MGGVLSGKLDPVVRELSAAECMIGQVTRYTIRRPLTYELGL